RCEKNTFTMESFKRDLEMQKAKMESGQDDDDSDFVWETYQGPRKSEKMTMTVSAVHDAHNKVIGVWVRFIVRDKSMNPGGFMNRVFTNLDQRRKAAVSRSVRHTERFPTYMSKFKTSHPLGDFNGEHVYRKMCEILLGEKIDPSNFNYISIGDHHFYNIYT